MSRDYIIGINEVTEKYLDKGGKLRKICQDRKEFEQIYNLLKKINYENYLLRDIVGALTNSIELCDDIDEYYNRVINLILEISKR
jgi:hypothetical protein